MRRNYAAIIVAVGLTLPGLAACSGDSETTVEETTESAAPTTAAPGDATLDSEGDVTVPDNWPEVVPLPSPATLTSATSVGESSSIMVTVDPPIASAVDAYAAQLVAVGFAPGASLETEDGITRDYQGNGYLVGIIGFEAAGSAGMTISAVPLG